MVGERFSQFKVETSGAMVLDGGRLEEFAILDRHYGFINRHSKQASRIVSPEDMALIHQQLGLDKPRDYKVLGGHEFLHAFPDFDEVSLREFWNTKKSLRLKSGFYFQSYRHLGHCIILVNGFHPMQLRRYTRPQHKILVLLLNTDTPWPKLKAELSGDTYPERAHSDSIRGEIFKNPEKYGLPQIAIANNCIHLSAGPFEGLFEMDNFLNNIPGTGYDLTKTNIARLMAQQAIKIDSVEHARQNPHATINGEDTDLFGFTEEKNTAEAIKDYRSYFYH